MTTQVLTGQVIEQVDRIADAVSAPLVVLDFDGVLAPFVDDPAESRATPAARVAVSAVLDAGMPVAIVSGRALASLAQVCDLDPRVLLIGGHGAEWAPHPSITRPARMASADPCRHARVRALLETVAARHPGTWVEVKPGAVALHVRTATGPVAEIALAAAYGLLRAEPGVHLLPGKNVAEGVLTQADKGTAVRALRGLLAVDRVLFVGDDVTDEAAFAVLGPGDLGVKVGPGATTAAQRVTDHTVVPALLQRLAARRRPELAELERV